MQKLHGNVFKCMFDRVRDMGNWSFYLNKDEEERIKRLVAEGKIRSVYVFVRKAVQDLIAEKTKEKDYWWRQDKK